MLDWYKTLIALRRETPGLIEGDPAAATATYDATRNLLLYSHAGLLVACNLGDNEVGVPEASDASLILAATAPASGDIAVLAPDSVSVWRCSQVPASRAPRIGP